jgi:hypothetical protein
LLYIKLSASHLFYISVSNLLLVKPIRSPKLAIKEWAEWYILKSGSFHHLCNSSPRQGNLYNAYQTSIIIGHWFTEVRLDLQEKESKIEKRQKEKIIASTNEIWREEGVICSRCWEIKKGRKYLAVEFGWFSLQKIEERRLGFARTIELPSPCSVRSDPEVRAQPFIDELRKMMKIKSSRDATPLELARLNGLRAESRREERFMSGTWNKYIVEACNL